MSITQLKALTWFLSAAVAGYLGWYVYDFFQSKSELSSSVTKETQTEVLNSVPEVEPPKDDVVDYQVVVRTWHNMDWIGKPPPKEAPKQADDAPAKLPFKPVSELLVVLLVHVDGGRPERSMAQVKYLDPVLDNANKGPDDRLLREGETLDTPYEGVKVARIQRDGVWFEFLTADGEPDPERPGELVSTRRLEGGERIVRVGEEGALVPAKRPLPQVAGPTGKFAPRDTRLVGNDHWWVGTDDRELIARSYTKILAEIRTKPHQDKSGKKDGIEILDVPKDSFAAKYGVKQGQVIKSINGHPVTSINEGISYAKQNQDKYDVWVIVYEEQGKEKTKVIDTTGD